MKNMIFAAAALALGIAAIEPASAAVAPFGCDARTGATCYFQIFYSPKRSRTVVLPAGTKVGIPDVTIDRGRYCVSVNAPPPHKCPQKVINDKYNN